MRRDTPRLDLLTGDRVDEHEVDVLRAQIIGSHTGEGESQRVQSRDTLQARRPVPRCCRPERALLECHLYTVDIVRVFHFGMLHEGGDILKRRIGQPIAPRRWRTLVPCVRARSAPPARGGGPHPVRPPSAR